MIFSFKVVISNSRFLLYCLESKKSLQMPLITSGTICSNPVNSLVKKVWDSLGSEAMSFRSSRGAQATPTEKTVIPTVRRKKKVKTILPMDTRKTAVSTYMNKSGLEKHVSIPADCPRLLDFATKYQELEDFSQ